MTRDREHNSGVSQLIPSFSGGAPAELHSAASSGVRLEMLDARAGLLFVLLMTVANTGHRTGGGSQWFVNDVTENF